MIINVSNCPNRIKKDTIYNATSFFCTELMDKNIRDDLQIDVELVEVSDRSNSAQANNEDYGCKNPRWFTIRLHTNVIPSEKELLISLAHELVHVRQYATNRLGSKRAFYTDCHKNEVAMATKWDGEWWTPPPGADPYFDSPWEKEAYQLETKLYDLFNQSLEEQ